MIALTQPDELEELHKQRENCNSSRCAPPKSLALIKNQLFFKPHIPVFTHQESDKFYKLKNLYNLVSLYSYINQKVIESKKKEGSRVDADFQDLTEILVEINQIYKKLKIRLKDSRKITSEVSFGKSRIRLYFLQWPLWIILMGRCRATTSMQTIGSYWWIARRRRNC